ncbi:MAG: type II toxin-antitoxin system VapC family toxin [Leptolyngbya sp. Prado105]|jgi:tRNA(fMet)-specific endonuclease VapC|nr:type II toxin-antitoxin system VapC family toxin [Leptolyngbya sp. Prado105]
MKYLFDTDHISIYQRRSGQSYINLASHLVRFPLSDFSVSIVTVQEQILGSHAYINRAKRREDVVRGYGMMSQAMRDLTIFEIVDFGDAEARIFEQFNVDKIQLKVMDARIAAIAISRGLILLTRNQRDFDKVPNLKTQDWTLRLGGLLKREGLIGMQ